MYIYKFYFFIQFLFIHLIFELFEFYLFYNLFIHLLIYLINLFILFSTFCFLFIYFYYIYTCIYACMRMYTHTYIYIYILKWIGPQMNLNLVFRLFYFVYLCSMHVSDFVSSSGNWKWLEWSLVSWGVILAMLSQWLMFKNAFLNIHRWLNITNITPHGPDDGSVEPKRYSVDFLINLSFHLDYLVINFYIYFNHTS